MPNPSFRPPVSPARSGGFAAIRALGAAFVLLVTSLAAAPAAAQRVLVPEREWSDATGMFKVQASLVGIEGTALTLRQTDGTDLAIELDQLAPLDQLIARRTIRRLAHRGEGPPQVEAFDTAARATNHTDFPPLVPEPLVADPADVGRGLVAGRVVITRRDPFDRVGRVIPLGGSGGVVLVGIENSTPGRPLPTTASPGVQMTSTALGLPPTACRLMPPPRGCDCTLKVSPALSSSLAVMRRPAGSNDVVDWSSLMAMGETT